MLQVSLAGLWLMPAVIAFHLKFWRFLTVWVVYSAVTGYLLYLSSGKKMHMSTPRKVRAQGMQYRSTSCRPTTYWQ